MAPRTHTVRKCDCLASISYRSGVPQDAIWDDPANAELHGRRSNPYVLATGDVVVIPDLRERREGGATENRYTYVRAGVPEIVRVLIRDEDGTALANVGYELVCASRGECGQASDTGEIVLHIMPDNREASLIIHTDFGDEVFHLQMGCLQPEDTQSGAVARLVNLGYDSFPDQLKPKLKSRAMLRAFQAEEALSQTGALDHDTSAALRTRYGC